MISGLFLSVMGLLLVAISFAVIKQRRYHKIAYGYGKNNEIIDVVSAHSNFVSYVPIFTIILVIIEIYFSAPPAIVASLACLFAIGRFLHFYGLVTFKNTNDLGLRVAGMLLTIFPLMASAIILGYYSFASFF